MASKSGQRTLFPANAARCGLVIALLLASALGTGCVWFAAGAAAGAVGATAAQDEERDAGDVVSDSVLLTRVKSALVASRKVHGQRVHVKVRLRVVTLTGMLPTEAEVTEAVRIANAVDGVEKVVSKLQVER